jgi:acetyl esterase/lipase
MRILRRVVNRRYMASVVLFLRHPSLWKSVIFAAGNSSLHLRYGLSPSQLLDVYPVVAGSDQKLSPAPVLVFVHGGAWSSGSRLMYRMVGTVSRAPPCVRDERRPHCVHTFELC